MAMSPTSFRAAEKGPLPVPGAFRLEASNGYTFYLAASPSYRGYPANVVILTFAKGKGVTYRAPATVTETSIQSDLGGLGKISVTFQRSGRAASAQCDEETVRFDSGSYVGTIAFHGEEGYTSVEAATVPGNIDYWLGGLCGEWFSEGFAGRPKGATLYLRNPALGQGMSVSKHRPGAAAEISASMSEYTSGGISIERYMGLRMSGADFTYDQRLRTATLRPPAPFSGSAHFDLGKKAGQRWSGNLAVDLPGKSDVPLTGASLRAYLVPSE